jgi:hypothetical protein
MRALLVIVACLALARAGLAITCGQAYNNGFTCAPGFRPTTNRNGTRCATSVCTSRWGSPPRLGATRSFADAACAESAATLPVRLRSAQRGAARRMMCL